LAAGVSLLALKTQASGNMEGCFLPDAPNRAFQKRNALERFSIEKYLF
jgi:hypothetical protein